MTKAYLNDYSRIEKDFFHKTGLSLVSGYECNRDIHLNQSISIIIPTYNSSDKIKKVLIALNKQYHGNELKNITEVIIVDDGSKDSEKLIKVIKTSQSIYKIILARFKINQGRSTARNLGIALSHGKILLFLDGDIIPNCFWLLSHAIRHTIYKNIVTVGLSQNIESSDYAISLKNLNKNFKSLNPDYKKDFRYKKYIPLDWRDAYPDIKLKNFNRFHYVLNESNLFKNFSYLRSFGVWSLPAMFVTNNVAIRREHVLKVGGFDFDFKGWGMEDTHLGWKLISKGIYIVPLLSATGFHILDQKIDLKTKIAEFKRNIFIYHQKIRTKTPTFRKNAWINLVLKRFANKYEKLIK